MLSVVTSDLNGRKIGDVELNNGYVTFMKNYLKEECIVLEFTFYNDCDDNEIYDHDLLQSEDGTVFEVVWNRNQACWWLNPIMDNTKLEDELFLVLSNQMLGNGYFKRRDLKKIGNKLTKLV